MCVCVYVGCVITSNIPESVNDDNDSSFTDSVYL
jgi:hypothetical protein